MRVTVRLFARARDLAGAEQLQIELTEPATVGQLKQRLQDHCPQLRQLLPQLHVAVGTEYATNETLLVESADVACFPSVSGG
jgi:molybdopterin converting factor subunit 1